MKRKIYIFNRKSKAAAYGVGTYIDNLIKILKTSKWEFELIYIYAEGEEITIAEMDGYRQISIPYPTTESENDDEYYRRNLVYILKEFIPEDKHTEYIFHLNYMGDYTLIRYLKKTYKCRIVTVIHYTDWSFSLFGDYGRLKKIYTQALKQLSTMDKAIVRSVKNDVKMAKKVDRVVCVAKHTLDTYSGLTGFPVEKAEIINNALEDSYKPLSEKEKQRLRDKYFIANGEKIIVFAGRLDEVKGVHFLIEAYKKILVKHADTRLFIAGEGDFSELLKNSANYWSKISFTGRLDKQKLYELYNMADIGVVCSLHEEFGYVAIEMMMHAIALVVTKTGGLDEIVEDGISGLKVPVRIRKEKRQIDVKILTEKIAFLLANPESAKIFGENGRKRFLKKYQLTLFKEKILNLYQTI